MSRIKPYPCTKCGLCCKRVAGALPAKEDGSCVYLKDNQCSIYENRPIICRVDLMIDLHGDSEERYKQNVRICNALQEDAGLDTSYRI